MAPVCPGSTTVQPPLEATRDAGTMRLSEQQLRDLGMTGATAPLLLVGETTHFTIHPKHTAQARYLLDPRCVHRLHGLIELQKGPAS